MQWHSGRTSPYSAASRPVSSACQMAESGCRAALLARRRTRGARPVLRRGDTTLPRCRCGTGAGRASRPWPWTGPRAGAGGGRGEGGGASGRCEVVGPGPSSHGAVALSTTPSAAICFSSRCAVVFGMPTAQARDVTPTGRRACLRARSSANAPATTLLGPVRGWGCGAGGIGGRMALSTHTSQTAAPVTHRCAPLRAGRRSGRRRAASDRGAGAGAAVQDRVRGPHAPCHRERGPTAATAGCRRSPEGTRLSPDCHSRHRR